MQSSRIKFRLLPINFVGVVSKMIEACAIIIDHEPRAFGFDW